MVLPEFSLLNAHQAVGDTVGSMKAYNIEVWIPSRLYHPNFENFEYRPLLMASPILGDDWKIYKPRRYESRSGMTFDFVYKVVRAGDEIRLEPLDKPTLARRVAVADAGVLRGKISRDLGCTVKAVLEALKTGDPRHVEEACCGCTYNPVMERQDAERFTKLHNEIDIVAVSSYRIEFAISAPWMEADAEEKVFEQDDLWAYTVRIAHSIPGVPAAQVMVASHLYLSSVLVVGGHSISPRNCVMELLATDMNFGRRAVLLRVTPLGEKAALVVRHPEHGEAEWRIPQPMSLLIVHWFKRRAG